jgi:catechol 2,3-dioxygenase-like lactoylglutathione lyase family enzyme
MTRLKNAIPVLLTLDPPAAVRFYEGRLGFRCRYQQEGLAILIRDDIELHFTKCPDRRLIEWSSCRIRVVDVDALYDEFSAQSVLHPKGHLRDTDYGTREFGIVDQDGVLLTFFEDRTGKAEARHP